MCEALPQSDLPRGPPRAGLQPEQPGRAAPRPGRLRRRGAAAPPAAFRRIRASTPGLAPPRGAPDLADGLSNLAGLHLSREDYAKAEPLLRLALAMVANSHTLRPSHPQGHPEIASTLNNLAGLHKEAGGVREGGAAAPRGLAKTRQALHPPGAVPARSPRPGRGLNNLAGLHDAPGSTPGRSRSSAGTRDARKPVPRPAQLPAGHRPGRITNNLACLHHWQGEYAKAERSPCAGPAMYRRLGSLPSSRARNRGRGSRLDAASQS